LIDTSRDQRLKNLFRNRYPMFNDFSQPLHKTSFLQLTAAEFLAGRFGLAEVAIVRKTNEQRGAMQRLIEAARWSIGGSAPVS
jgi:hypothetical protein